ncbi:MAG: DUF1905 domain-containing protein [Cyclobacteriaceae bacterium]|nr:DUF1905 domain-containing protein [Cyclobacteriaceae bacterium]
MDTAFISIPFDVQKAFAAKRVKVKATFDGYEYRGSIVDMGFGHCLGVRKDIRKAIGKSVGDRIQVIIEQDTEERIVVLPKELESILKKNPKASAFFSTLSYTNRKEYVNWIVSAKKEETKEKRLKEILKKLLSEKKNPSEK